MAVTKSGPMFLRSIDASDEIKNKDFVARHMRDVIIEVRPNNMVQIITDNVVVCKAASNVIELEFRSIYWTPCVVYTLNLALKNICEAKNTEKNSIAYDQYSSISQIADHATFIKNVIVGHSMRISISIASTY